METTAEAPAFQTIQPAVSLKRQETEPFGLNWTSYCTAALHDIVTGSIKELTALSRRGQTELRQRLLPALQEVRNRIAKGEAVDGCATMKAYLSSVGLHEGVIRLWEFRLREKEMQELLGDTELAALFAPLSESELESDRAFESTMVKAPAMETFVCKAPADHAAYRDAVGSGWVPASKDRRYAKDGYRSHRYVGVATKALGAGA